MPATIRADSAGHPRGGGFKSALWLAPMTAPTAATAQELERPLEGLPLLGAYMEALAAIERHELAGLALALGVIVFAVITAIALVRTRARAAEQQTAARAEIAALRHARDRAEALLLAEPQIVVTWNAGEDEPEIMGDTTIVSRTPVPRRALAFGTWLEPERAHALEDALESLRAHGQGFSMALVTSAGRHIEVEGRPIGGRAVMRIKDVTGAKHDLATLAASHQQLLRDIDTVRRLIEALPYPIWVRDAAARLVWANSAYAAAVEARDGPEAVARGLELLDLDEREEVARRRAAGEGFQARKPVIIAGKRRMLDLIDLPSRGGSAGIGIDTTEVETLRDALSRMSEAHRRTLDQLPTAVAIFGADQRLAFYNSAYRQLWALDAAFLDQQPTDSAVLDQLRAARRLPEQADFRKWKGELHEAYRVIEAREHEWHLPDGRTLRVVTTANLEGGVTYLFHDVTERLDLERRYDALIRVQGETLENLSEGVAVFGSDGRLRLFNPTFARMWRLTPEMLSERPHVEQVIRACAPLHDEAAIWSRLGAAVTGIESRTPVGGRMERLDGSVIDCTTMPLPDGATLVTFQDVTDTVNVERALRERADALLAADHLKSAFVQHVSYELRSPLTNIIGFAQLLDDRQTGPLTEKQHEYLGYINASSSALLAIINDILDLATIDAGAMQLDLGPVDIRRAMNAAAEGVRDRLAEHGIALDISVPADIGTFTADERRVRQIFYNLLSNAVGFSPPGETVTFTAERTADAVVFGVTDRGPGIADEIRDRVFDRFESHARGSRHRGAGLGLSIVRSFVELHGGTVALDSAVGRGTTVTCVFPIVVVRERAAAE